MPTPSSPVPSTRRRNILSALSAACQSIAPCRPCTRERPITSASKITSKSSTAPRKTSPPNDSSLRGLVNSAACAFSPLQTENFPLHRSLLESPESLRRSQDGVRQLLSEVPVRYELVADGQRWLGACGHRTIYAQIASHLWRDSLLYDAILLQLARYYALIGAMFASRN